MDFKEFFIVESYDETLNEARERVNLDDNERDMSVNDIMQKHDIKSKTTAWRAKRNGYFVPDYHKKEIIVNNKPLDGEKVLNSARKGVLSQLGSLMAGSGWGKNVRSFISPSTIDDYIQHAAARLVELGGHKDFDKEGFRVNTAKNATRDFFYSNLRHSRRQVDMEIV